MSDETRDEATPAGVAEDDPNEGYSEPVTEVRRRARLLNEIEKLASEIHPAEPVDCVNRIRKLLAEYDGGAQATEPRRLSPCPSWCTEHYEAQGTWNHSGLPRAVTGEPAEVSTNMEPILVSCWIEMREYPGVEKPEAVGVIEKIRADVELSHCQLRQLARWLLDVADKVEEIEGACRP